MTSLLDYTHQHAHEELCLMLKCGFFTGGRIETIGGLRLKNLERAVPDPRARGVWRIAVGPGASPSVPTKHDVTGQLLVPEPLLRQLRDYAGSVRRLVRQGIAPPSKRDLLFLTRFGGSYCDRSAGKSPSINQEMMRLRRNAQNDGLNFMQSFRFHQSRATFGTWLTEIALQVGDPVSAIAFVRDAMMHKHESTTFRYIKFVRDAKLKAAAANAFSEAFLGLAARARRH